MIRLILLCFLIAISCLSCDQKNSPNTLLESYLKRIVRVMAPQKFETAIFESQISPYPNYRDISLPLSDIRIGVFDFMALKNCGLQSLVASKNSNLGKLMPVSQKLLYEHEFLIKGDACLASINDDALYTDLSNAISKKRNDLEAVFWNATFASPEFAKLLASNVEPSLVFVANAPKPLDFFLQIKPQLGKSDFIIESSTLEHQYQNLAEDKYVGFLLVAMEELTFYLQKSSAAIELRLQQRPLCFQSKPNRKSEIMQNIFYEYYVGKIQPYLAAIHQSASEWLPKLDRLAQEQKEVMPTSFLLFYKKELAQNNSKGRWQSFNNAISYHTQAWQTLLKQCNAMPSGSSK